MNSKICVCFLLVSMTLLPLSGRDVVLMEKGKSACVIVLSEKPSLPEQHAAQELSRFLAKIGEGEAPAVVKSAPEGKNIITFRLLQQDPTLKKDGFRIVAKEGKVTVFSLEERGLLFGAYEILKRYGGIRWLFPGRDGEYFKVKSVISVPEGTFEKNADFHTRAVSAVCMSWDSPIWETWD
ncbi:MAG: hypothetical protein J6331_02340, partial [Lentisphaeria bacterium]|nr:hypothetical protein [Lentisphaeria bacterium]